MALILDTGPLYASLDRSDADHAACRDLIESAVEPLVIPGPVLVEVYHWIHRRLHPGVLVALIDDIREGAYRVEDLAAGDYRRVVRSATATRTLTSASSMRPSWPSWSAWTSRSWPRWIIGTSAC